MTIYGIHAYIISMNWSYYCITLGYNCLMMNIIQQVTDPMPTNLSLIDLAKLLLLLLLSHLIQNTANTVTVTIAIAFNVFITLVMFLYLLTFVSHPFLYYVFSIAQNHAPVNA